MTASDIRFRDLSVLTAISCCAFAAYLLLVDGVASAIFIHPSHDGFVVDSRWPLSLITGVRVLVEFAVGLASFAAACSTPRSSYFRIFTFTVSVYCLFGVGEMMVYTGALDEHRFFALIPGSIAIRTTVVLAGSAIYLITIRQSAPLFRTITNPVHPLSTIIFSVPLVLILLYFMAVPELRFNSTEYIRFMLYYAAANAGLLTIPKMKNGSEAIILTPTTMNNWLWLTLGITSAAAYIFQNSIRHALGIHWF